MTPQQTTLLPCSDNMEEDINFEGAQFSGGGSRRIQYGEDSSSRGEEEQHLDCKSHSPEVRKPALLDSYEEDYVGENIFQPTDGDKILKTNDENVRNVNCDDRLYNRRDECEKLLNRIMHNDDDKLTTTECLSVSMLVGGEHETTDGADIRKNNMTENECMKNDEATRALVEQMNVGRDEDECASAQDNDEECVFKRGYCITHKVKGEKRIMKSKK